KKNNGYVYADKKKRLQLLIDIKTDSITTLNKLIEVLRKYPSLINNRSLKFVISGNRPGENQFNSYPLFIWFDGILSHQYDSKALKKIALMSDNIANYVYGNDVTPGEWQRLQITVKRAHDLKL